MKNVNIFPYIKQLPEHVNRKSRAGPSGIKVLYEKRIHVL